MKKVPNQAPSNLPPFLLMADQGFDELVGQVELALQNGDIPSARSFLEIATAQAPDTTLAHFQLGSLKFNLEDFNGAIHHFKQATILDPELPEPWQNMGLALEAMLRFDDAVPAFSRATELAPDWLDPWKSLGCTLARLDRSAEAIKPLETASKLAPNDSQITFFLGNSYLAVGDSKNAVKTLGTAAVLLPDDADVLNNLGQALELSGDFDRAAKAYANARILSSDHLRANRGYARVLLQLKRGAEAEVALRQIISLKPEEPEAYVELGSYLQNNQRNREAADIMLKAVNFAGDDPILVNNLAVSLASIGEYSKAKKWYDKLIQLVPDRAGPLVNYATMLEMLEQSDEALVMLQQAVRIDPSYAPTYSLLVHGKLRQCQWDNLEALVTRIIDDSKQEISEGKRLSALPFVLLALPVPLDIRLEASRQLAMTARSSVLAPTKETPFHHNPRSPSRKIRIGYISPDFRMHSVGMCFRSVVTNHDRQKFEVYGYHMATKPDDDTTTFFKESFDTFRDIRELSTADAARLIHEDGIDILVDLAGHTRGSRIEILSLKPAPVQVQYLGYGATTGAGFIDYLITDDTVMNEEASRWCSEALAFLPQTFMPPLGLPCPANTLDRQEEGLPENGFVFANFSAHYKIDPEMFSIWMRILKRTPGSVLWLISGSEKSVENLRREAKARGVDPERLIMAKRCHHETHLARHHLADLCLDNYFHAGGATTLEALACGLPVLTHMGPYPNSRTGAGMLKAAGLPELVARDLTEYGKIALALAQSPDRISALRNHLSKDKHAIPLFNSSLFVARLEQLLFGMWEKYQAGEPAATIRLDI